MGETKSALITFSREPEFSEELETASKKQFEKPKRPDSEDDWVNFQDWFTLEYQFENGETVVGLFVENYKHAMSKDVRELIL